jgi:hypothetical protein
MESRGTGPLILADWSAMWSSPVRGSHPIAEAWTDRPSTPTTCSFATRSRFDQPIVSALLTRWGLSTARQHLPLLDGPFERFVQLPAG